LSRRPIRIAALVVIAALLLATGGVLVWSWSSDYRSYRRAIASLDYPGQYDRGSFEEFLSYRRGIAFYDAADRLEVGDSMNEVRAVLGEPDRVEQMDGEESWFYSGPVFRERRQPTIVVDIDRKTSRVVALGVINHL
jgi:hypothetical protein